jgi:MoxR-like ATPase
VVKNEKNEVIKDNTDDCIRDIAKSTTYFLDGEFSDLIMGEIDEEKLKLENKDYIDLLSNAYENDLDGKIFDIPLIFINEEKMKYESLKIDDIIKNKSNSLKDYLKWMKKMLYIANDVEKEENGLKSLLSILNYKTDNYVITNDNFTKMILLVYRILADIPVIIMGETGCGKTALITKLSQLLNNGEIMVEIINIHPGITDEYLCQKMEEMNKKAKKQNKELWVFFDEINTCLSLSLLTEIFVNKSFNRKPLEKNIRLIGACNPYRKRQQEIEICGYSRENDGKKDKVDLIYLVQPLPQSLLNFVFSFGALNPEDEKKYIYSIIEKLFKKGEEKLHEATKEVIFNCHKYLRDTFDTSVVSLREINRFAKIVGFFQKYFTIKRKCEEKEENYKGEDDKKEPGKPNEQNTRKENIEKFDKILSIICSVYLCYYIRLIDEAKRTQFNNDLKPYLIELVNLIQIQAPINLKVASTKSNEEDSTLTTNDNIGSQITNRYLQSFIQENGIKYFSDFLRLEEQYLIDKIELKKGIGKNDLLKENLFLMFVAVTTQIPLIIVGKPGTGKSLSSQLICNAMKGEYSKDEFFREFSQIILTYFQGAESTSPDDVEKLFEIAGNKLNYYKDKEEYKNKLPISMILFDELGLAEKSESNPLKVLHSKLEYSGCTEGVSFIGISNYSLDAAKVNRAMNLSVPNLESHIDQLNETTSSIVESISEELKDNKIFEFLSRAYYEYKNELRLIKELIALKEYNEEIKGIDKNALFNEIKLKKEYKNKLKKEKKITEDFHSNRDLYYYIRGIASRIAILDSFDEAEVKRIINNCIERNFGGIEYEIDIDFNLKLDIKNQVDTLFKILKEKIDEKKKEKKPARGKKGNKSEKENKDKFKEDSNKEDKNEKEKKEVEKKDKLMVNSVFLFKKII